MSVSQANDSIWRRTKCSIPYFGFGPGWTVDHERLNPAAGPAADPDLGEIADVVGMQVRREVGGDVLMWDFERGEIRLRAGPEIEDEFVAVAELDQPGRVGLRAAHERPACAERDDAHLVRGQRLGVGESSSRDNFPRRSLRFQIGCVRHHQRVGLDSAQQPDKRLEVL